MDIVIIGGGIIGSCTAYYLTRHPLYKSKVKSCTILEACQVAAGASGKAGGLLAEDWHGSATASLATLSFRLHRELAHEHKGESRWGYRTVETLSVVTGSTKRRKNKAATAVAVSGIDWVRSDILLEKRTLGTHKTTAQVHPRLFTTAMAELAQEQGVKVVIGKAEEMRSRGGTVEGVVYNNEYKKQEVIPADVIVVAAGPWSSTLGAKYITGQRAHSVVIEADVAPQALFTDMHLEGGLNVAPELYARPNGEVYVCGEGDSNVPLPLLASEVAVEQERCDELIQHSALLSAQLEHGKVRARQACYLPLNQYSGVPLLGEGHLKVKGAYLAAGHSCWGICLAPGTGKIMAEMILDGKPSSASIAELL